MRQAQRQDMSVWDETTDWASSSSLKNDIKSTRMRKDEANGFLQFLSTCFGRGKLSQQALHPVLINTLATFADATMNGVSFDIRKVKRETFPERLRYASLQKHDVLVVKQPKLNDDETYSLSMFDEIASELRILSDTGMQQHANILDLVSVVYVNAGSFLEPQILPALVVEYAEFGNITDFQASGLDITIQDKYDMCRDIARGLSYVHHRGVIHADVKASNMLVCRHPTRKFIVKLSDFGFAFLTSDEHPMLAGLTLYWAAPEASKPLDHRYLCQLDIYPYGLLVFNILRNGRNYYEPDPVFQQPDLLRTVKETNLLPEMLEFNLLSKVEDRCLLLIFCKIVRYCLRANPAERYHSMEHILRNLVWADPSVLSPHEGDDVPPHFYNIKTFPVSYYYDHKNRLMAAFKQQLETYTKEVGDPIAFPLKDLYLKRMVKEMDMILFKPESTDTERYRLCPCIELMLWRFIGGISTLGRPSDGQYNKFSKPVPSDLSNEDSKILPVTGAELDLSSHRRVLKSMHPSIQMFIHQQLQTIVSSLKEPEKQRRILYNLAFCCIEGIGTPFDVERALSLLQEAAELGDLDAQNYMRQVYAADSHLAQVNQSNFVAWASNSNQPRVLKAMRQHHRTDYHKLQQTRHLTRLLKHSDDHFKMSEWKISFVHFGATMNMGRLIRQLLDTDSSLINCKNYFGQTPLIASCQAGSYEATLEILSYGADVNAQDEIGFTALHWLGSFTDEQKVILVDAFKSKAANTNLEGKIPEKLSVLPQNLYGGFTQTGSPLIWAVTLSDQSSTDALLQLGANPFVRSQRLPYSPLEFACLIGASDCVLRFEKETGWRGALSQYYPIDKNARANALYWALENSGRWYRVMRHGRNFEIVSETIIKTLLQGGVSCEAVVIDRTQRIPAPYAVAQGRCDADIMRAGLNHGFSAYLDTTCDYTASGPRAMAMAIANGDYEMFEYLVRAGASCVWENFEGCSALRLAPQASDDVRFVKTLLDTGGMAVDENKDLTPFMVAVWHGNLKTAKFLWDRGAKRDMFSKRFGRTILGEMVLLCTKTVLPRIKFLLDLPDQDGSDGFCAQEPTDKIVRPLSLLHLAVDPYQASERRDEDPEMISRCQLNLSMLLAKYSAPKYLNSNMGVCNSTPLATAVFLGNQFAVQMLLEAGADPNITDQFNTSPTDRALIRMCQPQNVHAIEKCDWTNRRELEKTLTAVNRNTAAILSLLKSYGGQISRFPLSTFNLSNWHDFKIGFRDVESIMNSKPQEALRPMEQNESPWSKILGVDHPQMQSLSTALAQSRMEDLTIDNSTLERINKQGADLNTVQLENAAGPAVKATENNPAVSMEETSDTNPSVLGQNSDLPAGWEARHNEDGRVYYINHTNQKTSWVNPLLLGQQSDLPDGWEARQTKSGRVYYVDHRNKKTSWEEPSNLKHQSDLHEE